MASTRRQRSRMALRDPVCGMVVDPHTTKHRHQHDGRTYYFCSGGCLAKFAADPAKYISPSPTNDSQCSRRHDLYVPNASADSAGRSWLLSDLRHGARAGSCDGRSGAECRIDRHEPPILDRPRSLASGRGAGDGRTFDRSQPLPQPIDVELDSNDSGHPGRALVRVAVFRARLAIRCSPAI